MKIALPLPMQKFKTPLIVSVSAAIVAVVLYFLLRTSGGVFTAIPKSTIAAVEIRNWNGTTQKLNNTLAGAAWKKTDAAQKLLAEIAVMQQLLDADKSLKEAIATGTVASVHLTTATDYGLLFTTELKGVNDNTLLNRIQSSPLVRKVGIRIFKNQKIIEAELKSGRQLCLAKVNNVLAFSFTSFLTENSVTASLTGDNLQDEGSFKSIRSKNSAADVIVYFNYQKADVILPVLVLADKVPLLADVKNAGEWGCYELTFSNGQTEIVATVSVADEQTASSTDANAFTALLSSIPNNAAYVNMSLHQAPTKSDMLQSYFKNWAGGAKAFVITEPLNTNFSDRNLCLVSVTNPVAALAGLRSLISANGDDAQPIDTFSTHEVYFLKDGTAIQQYFGNSLVRFSQCYFTVAGGVALFAQSADVLQLALEKIANKETLNSDADFLNSGNGNLTENAGMLYVHPQRAEMLIRGLLKENSTLLEFLSLQQTILQFSKVEKEKLTARIFIKQGTDQKASAGLLWKTKLLTVSTFTPQEIGNAATGESEIFTQDTLNNVYLLNRAGQILFSKNTGAPVVGRVVQIDYYNNGSQQIIFSTSRHIYVVDRAGNNIGSFPLQLTAETRSGLLVVTENNKSRYYVPCTNGNIYGYETNGKPLPGFSPLGGVGYIEQPLQYVAFKGKGYLLAYTNEGNLLLYDLLGKQKWKMEHMASAQNFSMVNGALLNAIGNQLVEISIDGNDSLLPLMDSADFFAALVTSDTSYTYYFSRQNQLRAYSHKQVFAAAASFNLPIMGLEPINILGANYLLVKTAESCFVYDTRLKKITTFNLKNTNAAYVTGLVSQNRFVAFAATTDGYLACYRLP